MVKIDTEGDEGGEFDEELRPPQFKVKLRHKSRIEGTVAEVSDIWTTDSYSGDEEVDKLSVYFRKPIEELDLDDDKKEALREYVKKHNEEIEEVNEKREDAGLDEIPTMPEGVLQLTYYCTANLTRGEQSSHNSNLYTTLRELGLVEPVGDGRKFKILNSDGEHVKPFEDVQDEDELGEKLVEYLRKNLTGKECEIEIKNANRDNDKDEYSVVGEVIREVKD